MPNLARLASVALAAVVWALVAVTSTFACSGENASLRDGFRGATSIYYARIVQIVPSDLGPYAVILDVGRVLRGDAKTHVKVINAEVCDGLDVGAAGVVALGSVNPFGVGPDDTYNFFFVLGPGHASRQDVLAALSDVPETDTSSLPTEPAAADRVLPVVMLGIAWFALVMVVPRRRTQESDFSLE